MDIGISLISGPQKPGGGKGNKVPRLKNGQALWGDEVEIAFIEALQIYPSMGNRRLKCHQLPSGDPSLESTTGSTILPIKSFGYHQLIQSYIRQKTGHYRSTKQISSHLQRFRKNLHTQTPAEREKSFSLRYYDICGSSDGVANSQSETSNLVPQSQGTHLHSTTFIVPQIVYPNIMFRSSGENFGDGPKKNYKSKPRNFGTSMDNMYLSHSQAKHLSMTERRLQSNTPVVQDQLQLPVHTPSTWYQELISPFHGEGLRTGHDQNPITPMDQIPHFPLQLLEIQRDDKRKVDDCMLGWRRSPSLDRSTPQEVSKSYNSPQDFMRGASNLSQSLTALTGASYISSSEARSDDSSSPNSLHRKLSYSNTCSFTSPPLGYSATIGLFSPTATSDVESMDSVLQPPIEKHEY